MADSRKTKRELIAELQKLRRRVALLESGKKKADSANSQPAAIKMNRSPRSRLKADIELIGDFDIISARAVNVSQGGICFKTTINLPFEMRYASDGRTVTRRAHLIWLKHLKNGGYNFGLKFIHDEEEPQF